MKTLFQDYQKKNLPSISFFGWIILIDKLLMCLSRQTSLSESKRLHLTLGFFLEAFH